MGGSQSREDLEILDSDVEEDDYETQDEESEEDEHYDDANGGDEESEENRVRSSSGRRGRRRGTTKQQTPSSVDEVEAKLRALKLKYPSQSQTPNLNNSVRLYLHFGGNTPKAKWITSEKFTTYSFVRASEAHDADEEDEDEGEDEDEVASEWVLKIGAKVRAVVSAAMQLKTFADQRRADFVSQGVWAVKFFSDEDYGSFVTKFNDCLFENMYKVECTEQNKVKVYGKDFIGWVKPEVANDSVWEDADDGLTRSPDPITPVRTRHNLREEFEEAAHGGGAIQSLALGALDNSFLVSDSGVQVVKNYNDGLHGKGVYVKFNAGNHGNGSGLVHSTPKKALLMRAETNMLLMSPANEERSHPRGLHQLDIETGKIVTEWKFEKDGTDISMRDITNDNKGAQLDPTGSTFLGLDNNRLCRWDMRDRKGHVQDLVSGNEPVLNWTHGHQFSRGTNFQCFATTGDGSIVVGSFDGKIRLYSGNSMRQAKTAFPGLGSPITHVDVTFDGRWILGTTDNYLILICTIFTDKDGKTKTGFSGRMGNRSSAPRMLKLTPLDSHLAGLNNKFRSAQFSWVTENGKQERHLVATVGKFSVIWNFQQVKNGSHECYRHQAGLKSCYCYRIASKDEAVIDSRFMNDKFSVTDSPEAPLVVATSMKVRSFSISSKR